MAERFKLDAVYPNADYVKSLALAKQYFYGVFATKCMAVLYAVYKPLAVALQTKSVIEVRKAIELSRDTVETFYELALTLVSADELSSEAITPSALAVESEIVQPPSKPYQPPREAEEPLVVDSGSPAPSIYAGFEPDE